MKRFIIFLIYFLMLDLTTSCSAAQTLTNTLETPLKGRVVSVAQGATFSAKMQSHVNSETLKKGDIVAATLSRDWTYNDELIAPKGSILYGEALQVEPAGKAYKNGRFEIKFNEIVTTKGETIKLATNTYVLAVDLNRTLKIAGNILCGTIMGVVVGALYTVLSDGNVILGLIVGAGVGLSASALFSVAQTGDNVELPRNTPLKITLSEPIKVNVSDP